MLETHLSWYREGRMDESEFRSVTSHLAQSGLTLEHPMLGCGMLLDVVGGTGEAACRAHPGACWLVGRAALHAVLAVG